MPQLEPPGSVDELLSRAEAIAGLSLGHLAEKYQAYIPDNLLLEKGWVGQFLEYLLGASAGSLPQPDFPQLGIELKTLPVNESGKPGESTYVSVVPMHENRYESWEQSVVKSKLSCVLWIPIVSPKGVATKERIVGMPILWRPSIEEMHILRMDWEEAMEKVALGRLGELNARFGQALQVRPKAAHSRVITDAIGPDGEKTKTLPRGFYLRPSFTGQILKNYYCQIG